VGSKKENAWWRVDGTLDQAEMALLKAQAKRNEQEKLRAMPPPEPEPFHFTSLDDVPQWITVKKIVEKTQIKEAIVRRDIKSRMLRAHFDGHEYKIDPKDVGPWLTWRLNQPNKKGA
jgi:hypothetical protein